MQAEAKAHAERKPTPFISSAIDDCIARGRDVTAGVATGTIAAADYDAFVSVAHAADDGFLATTRVTTP